MDDEEFRGRDLRMWQQITFVAAIAILLVVAAAYRVFVLEDGGWADVAALASLLLGIVLVRVLWLTIRRR